MNRAASFVFTAVLVCISAVAQSNPSGVVDKAATQQKELNDCQAKVQEWRDWYNQRGYERLREENEELRGAQHRIIVGFASFGIAVVVAFGIWQFLRQVWPSSLAAKQLIVFTISGVWISAAALINASNPKLALHPFSLLFIVAMYSIPACLFALVALWWIARHRARMPSGSVEWEVMPPERKTRG